MWITPETRKLCPFTKFSWSYPYFNILNEKSLGTQHRISAVILRGPTRVLRLIFVNLWLILSGTTLILRGFQKSNKNEQGICYRRHSWLQ